MSDKIKILDNTYDKGINKVVKEINILLLQKENIDMRLKILCNKTEKRRFTIFKEKHEEYMKKVVEEINALLLQRENIVMRLKILCDKADKENYLMVIE